VHVVHCSMGKAVGLELIDDIARLIKYTYIMLDTTIDNIACVLAVTSECFFT